jgi:hypothetical protein
MTERTNKINPEPEGRQIPEFFMDGEEYGNGIILS